MQVGFLLIAIVLSGGPSSVYAPGAPQVDPTLFEAGVPAFGICYGFQAMAAALGGTVAQTGTAEFGSDVPPRTHAWFAGWSGDLAFAVLVEDGGFGGAVAAPLAVIRWQWLHPRRTCWEHLHN